MGVASVASTTTSTQLSDSSSRGRTIYNSDANALYVLLARGTASSTNFSLVLQTGDLYEVPPEYEGEIVGVWAADGSGAALVTEF